MNQSIYTLTGIIINIYVYLYPNGYTMNLNDFIKEKRKLLKLTQPELAVKAGVGIRFLRELERGKETLRIDKVNQVLQLFGHQLAPVQSSKTK